MSVSVDGFIADREGAFGWTVPNEEQFVSTLADRRASAVICAAAGFPGSCCRGRRIRRCATTSSRPRSLTSGARSRRSSSAARLTPFRAIPAPLGGGGRGGLRGGPLGRPKPPDRRRRGAAAAAEVGGLTGGARFVFPSGAVGGGRPSSRRPTTTLRSPPGAGRAGGAGVTCGGGGGARGRPGRARAPGPLPPASCRVIPEL